MNSIFLIGLLMGTFIQFCIWYIGKRLIKQYKEMKIDKRVFTEEDIKEDDWKFKAKRVFKSARTIYGDRIANHVFNEMAKNCKDSNQFDLESYLIKCREKFTNAKWEYFT